jgi:hypothetical protein
MRKPFIFTHRRMEVIKNTILFSTCQFTHIFLPIPASAKRRTLGQEGEEEKS